VKTIRYANDALRALRKHRTQAAFITAKIERYAETGAGDVAKLVGQPASRLRAGDYRVIFQETATEISVLAIGARGEIYD
jgi:mRNA interferase RelE/StbE